MGYSKVKFDGDIKVAKVLIGESELIADTLQAVRLGQACLYIPSKNPLKGGHKK